VDLGIYNLDGRLVQTLVNKQKSAGEQRVTWDGHDFDGNKVASGVYFVRLKAGGQVVTKKIVLLK
jgi:flagellar hook assembly protein FlgD